jgi:AcrR family transcriptional regulator
MRNTQGAPTHDVKVSERSPTRQGTRERILDAAARVVATRGLAHATTKEIARAAKLSEAALYKYFRDKDELVLLLMFERLPQWLGVLTELLARVGKRSVVANLEAVVYQAILFYADFVPMASSLFAEPDILVKHQKRLHRDNIGVQHANAAVAEYIRGEQRAERIARTVDPDAASALVLGGAFQRAFLRRYLGLAIEEKAERTFAKQLVRTLATTLLAE